MTKRIALLGHPVAHSISPAFQQAALDACAIDAVYEAWDTRPEELRIAVERLRSGDLMGANVTVPHKVSAMRLVDRPDPLSEQVGALNTIVHRNGLLEATNTDVTGILRSLASADVEVRGAEVLLVGAGGAARAVVVAMRSAGAARVVVANRTPERAAALAALGGTDLDMRYVPLDPEDTGFRGAVGRARIIVQSTSLGMRHGPDEAANPVPGDLMHPGQLAFDLVYVPEETPFLAAAAEAGARALGGLSMLVHQGAEAFRLWTGAPPPLDVMFDAAREALALRSTGAGVGPEDG